MSFQQHYPVCAFGFHIGEQVAIDGDQCRISGQNPDGTVTFVSYRSGRHIPLTRDEFMTKLRGGAVVINPPKSRLSASRNLLSSAMLTKTASGTLYFDHAAYKAEIIKAVLVVPVGQRTNRLIDGLLAKTHRNYLERMEYPAWLVKKAPPARSTVYRWLKAAEYRANVSLLVPAVHLRGARGGRCHPLIEDCMANLCEEIYFNAPEAQLSAAAENIRTEIDELILRTPLLAGFRPPSKATILRRIANLGGERRLEHDEGKRIARLSYKQVMQGPDLLYPMARLEIDHTKIDVIIIDNDGKRVIGRVWLTCLIDHKTRMIAGYILDSQAPDSASVLAALRFAILPKTRAQLDELGVKSEWPVAGVPTELATDRGKDFLSMAVQRSLQALSIDLVKMPPRTPQSKGRIERFFGTLNSLLFHQLVGTTKSNSAAKGDRKPEEHAGITFEELNSLIARTICDVYHNKWHSVLKCTPLQMWQRLNAKYPVPELKSGPEVHEATMMSYTGIATRSGIKIEGTRYGSPDVSRLRSQAHAHFRGNPVVDVLLDPEDISSIRILDPKTRQAIDVPALDAANLRGVSLRMHRLVMAELKARSLDSSPTNYATLRAALMADLRRINRRKRRHFTKLLPVIGPESPPAEPPVSTSVSAPNRPRKPKPLKGTSAAKVMPKLRKNYLGD